MEFWGRFRVSMVVGVVCYVRLSGAIGVARVYTSLSLCVCVCSPSLASRCLRTVPWFFLLTQAVVVVVFFVVVAIPNSHPKPQDSQGDGLVRSLPEPTRAQGVCACAFVVGIDRTTLVTNE